MYRLIALPLLRLARTLCVICFSTFCLLTLLQVINRYALDLQMFWTEEVAVLLFVWSVMIGVPVALWDHQEIAVDLFSLPKGPLRSLLSAFSDVVSFAFLIMLAVAGFILMIRAGNALTPTLGMPRYWAYLSIPVGSLLGALMLVARKFHPPNGMNVEPDSKNVDYAHD